MIKSDVVRIPPRRLEQLRAIAGAHKLSVADTIAHMIRKEISAGTIPAAIPGFIVKAVEGGVSIQIDEEPAATFSSVAARALASTIRDAVAGRPGVVSLDYHYVFMRRGAGYKLAAPFPGKEHSLSGDLALDIAELIEKAI